jgi:hypothetical protein
MNGRRLNHLAFMVAVRVPITVMRDASLDTLEKIGIERDKETRLDTPEKIHIP